MLDRGPADILADPLYAAWDALPSPVALLDAPQGTVHYANPALRAHLGDAACAPGATLPMACPLAVAHALASGHATHDCAVPSFAGPARWWDVSLVPFGGAPSHPPRLLMTAHDVTAHVLAQREGPPPPERTVAPPDRSALPWNSAALRAVLRQIPAAIFIVEAPDGRVVFQSDQVDQVLDTPPHDLAVARADMRGWAEHPDGRPYAIGEFPSRRALFSGETITGEPMIYYRGDGERIDLAIYAGPVRDETGAIAAAVSAAFDVTSQRRAEATLRESEARLRVATEAAGLGTWEVDITAGLTRFGPEFARMLGLPPEPMSDLRGIGARFVHPADLARVQAEFAAATAAGGRYHSEFRGRTVQGETRWFVADGRTLPTAPGDPVRVVGLLRDVTQRRLREERLRQALEQREVLFREADHRIKNSLQLVASLLGLQRARLTDPEAIAALNESVARVIAVSEAHRALHRSADLRHIALGGMLQDLCTHVQTLNPALHIACDCPPELELDTERAIPIGLVVSELLTNAAKHAYGEAGGAVQLTVACTGDVAITIADQGAGMADTTGPDRGLGSSIVRALAKQASATVDIRSAPGAGTATTLRFASHGALAGTEDVPGSYVAGEKTPL